MGGPMKIKWVNRKSKNNSPKVPFFLKKRGKNPVFFFPDFSCYPGSPKTLHIVIRLLFFFSLCGDYRIVSLTVYFIRVAFFHKFHQFWKKSTTGTQIYLTRKPVSSIGHLAQSRTRTYEFKRFFRYLR